MRKSVLDARFVISVSLLLLFLGQCIIPVNHSDPVAWICNPDDSKTESYPAINSYTYDGFTYGLSYGFPLPFIDISYYGCFNNREATYNWRYPFLLVDIIVMVGIVILPYILSVLWRVLWESA